MYGVGLFGIIFEGIVWLNGENWFCWLIFCRFMWDFGVEVVVGIDGCIE